MGYRQRMRVLLAAVSALIIGVALVANTGFAEPPPAMESRPIEKVIAALKTEKDRRSDLAALRFYADVFGGETVSAPVGSALNRLGAWGDNSALMSAENALNGCKPLEPEAQKKASAIVKEFGNELPVLLRAYAIAGEGRQKDASALFVSTLEGMRVSKECPREHPMYSNRRIGRMTLILECVKTLEPTRDVKELGVLIDQARKCALNNHAVG